MKTTKQKQPQPTPQMTLAECVHWWTKEWRGKQPQPTPQMTLAECVHWWTKEWRGTFDVQLYLKVCEIKSKNS
jgi:hypothetical protein